MFNSPEEERRALGALEDSVALFNRKYGVTADFGVFDKATDKATANAAFVDAFKGLLEQVVHGGTSIKNFDIFSMRSAFEREVVAPYREYTVNKATEAEVDRVRGSLPDANAGMNTEEWWREISGYIDGIYWKNVDRIVGNYKNRSPRIRDMVAETNSILTSEGEISQDDAVKIAGYAAALRRANESRTGIWRLVYFFRGRAELREAANFEKMLNEKLRDPDAYRNALAQLTDPNGRIGELKRVADVNKNVKVDWATTLSAKDKSREKPKKAEPRVNEAEERLNISIEEEKPIAKSVAEETVPGNERLYALVGNNSFVAKIKDGFWKLLKLVETLDMDKETTMDELFKPLLDNAKSINEEYRRMSDLGVSTEEIGASIAENAKSMFNEVYFNLDKFNLKTVDRVVAAQRITDTMLNELTVIGFERETLGKYGNAYALEEREELYELLKMTDPSLSDGGCDIVAASAKKELAALGKERVKLSQEDLSHGEVSAVIKQENKPSRGMFLNK